jgi:hypothetical protein
MSVVTVNTNECAAAKVVPKMHRKKWSKEEDEQLNTRSANGWTISQLASEHQRTSIAIKLRILKMIVAKIKAGALKAEEAVKVYPVSLEDVTMFQEQEDTRKANSQRKRELKQAIKTMSTKEVAAKFTISEEDVELLKSKEEYKKNYQKAKKISKIREKRQGTGPWSKEDEEYLLKNATNGVVTKEIYTKLSRTKRATETRLKSIVKRKYYAGEMSSNYIQDTYGYNISSYTEEDDVDVLENTFDQIRSKFFNLSIEEGEKLLQALSEKIKEY